MPNTLAHVGAKERQPVGRSKTLARGGHMASVSPRIFLRFSDDSTSCYYGSHLFASAP